MKTILLVCLLATNTLADEPIVARVTAENLAKLQQMDPMTRLAKPPANETKAVRPQTQSIISQSTILRNGDSWTLVPAGAVVFLPDKLKERISAKPAGILLPWLAFLTNNRNWITTQEVTIAQAAGNVPLPPERVAFWITQEKIVIAVHQSGPISVRMAAGPTRKPTQP